MAEARLPKPHLFHLTRPLLSPPYHAALNGGGFEKEPGRESIWGRGTQFLREKRTERRLQGQRQISQIFQSCLGQYYVEIREPKRGSWHLPQNQSSCTQWNLANFPFGQPRREADGKYLLCDKGNSRHVNIIVRVIIAKLYVVIILFIWVNGIFNGQKFLEYYASSSVDLMYFTPGVDSFSQLLYQKTKLVVVIIMKLKKWQQQ